MARKPTSKADLGPTTPPEKLRGKPTSSTGKTARTKSASEVATLLDVNRGTVKRWIDAGAPVAKEPAFEGDSYDLDVAEVVKWLQERAVTAAVDAGPPDDEGGPPRPAGYEDKEEADRRRAVALANIAEMEEEEKAGTVVPIDAVESLISEEILACRTKLENLGSTLAGRTARITDAAQVKALADELVAEAVACLVGDLSSLMAGDD